MKYLLIFLPIFIYAKSYIGVVEPVNEFTIYAKTSGEIVSLDKNDEMKILTKDIIKIDKSLEVDTLKLYEEQLKLYNQKLEIMQSNYEKYITIRGMSKVDKDNKLLEIIDLKNSIATLKISIVDLKNSIKDKTISINNLYLKEFLVNKYDYLTAGTKVATVYDMSKSKLTVYVNAEDYKNIKNKLIYINDVKSDYKINKIDITTDTTYISSYKTEVLIDSKEYGKTLKVEFKNE
ncbi:HlyD family secretion protein [Halarcobacter ebronensis]|uniref:HlyD family secretion protein n=1 Tax=Halarcobacter ebronensis TaxID=1462615 RepID=A0A4Q1AVG5_9BACT|nr:HlyD family secretion protein [Halarcobacter ebronensis]QKF82077.1 RND family efflux system, membrane fusion protein [Halarcobacter ebronensis]RXK04091.1 hypothetical protein CRV07_11735 [Halarcobacter ebronensis]